MIAADKYAHLWIGSVLAMPSLWLGWYGAVPVIVYAVGKEARDYFFPKSHTADVWDAAATIVGGAVPLALIMLHRAHP